MFKSDLRKSQLYNDYDWFIIRLRLFTVGIIMITVGIATVLIQCYPRFAFEIMVFVLFAFLILIMVRWAASYFVRLQFGVTSNLPSGWETLFEYLVFNFSPEKLKRISIFLISFILLWLIVFLNLIFRRIIQYDIFDIFSLLFVFGFTYIYVSLKKKDKNSI